MPAVASDDVTSVVAPGNSATGGRPLATVLAANARSGADGPAAARTSVEVGSVVRGRFELESMLGEGGMGVVYRAVDR
jgi:hypothetical protein